MVAGRRPGVETVVADGVGGMLVPPGDEAAFAEAVTAMLADPPRRAAMGARARDYVRERHDVTQAAAALGAILERVPRDRSTP